MNKIQFPTKDDPRNWPEDFSHENGNYYCKCMFCGQPFIGHKRRVVCKLCFEEPFNPMKEFAPVPDHSSDVDYSVTAEEKQKVFDIHIQRSTEQVEVLIKQGYLQP